MTIAHRVRLLATVSTRSEAAGRLNAPGDAVLIQRGRPRWLLLSCPDGCGEQVPINLDPLAGPAWRLYHGSRGAGLSLFPSVWRETGCESHFIIWSGRILLFGNNDEELDPSLESAEITLLTNSVRERLPATGLIPFSDIADALDAVPWDVLTVCRRLVRAGFAREGKRESRGSFGRV